MSRIPDEILEQVRDRVDVVDLIGRFVGLKQAGRNHKGLCPFHEEKTPSFNVNRDRQSYYCFGCQEGGNAFTFLMKLENLTFPEAVRTLAREVGIEIPETGGDGGRSERLFEATEVAQAEYRRALAAPANPGGVYLAERGLDPETIERFGIGFAPDRWDGVASALRARKLSGEVGERAGLLKERASGGHYDLLRNRVTFPIRDARGRVLGFGGRAVSGDQQPKYLNTPESPIFKKRSALFGLPLALEPIRRRERAVVVEGYFDLIALHRAGIGEALATCGTALTEEHARGLRRRTRHVVLLFDGDEAGQKAALRALETLLPADLRVSVALLPPGEDPDDFLAREGPDALRKLVDDAQPALHVAIQRAVAEGVESPWEKADAVAAVVPLLARVPSPVERAEFGRRLALAVGTGAEHVEQAVRAARRGEEAPLDAPAPPRSRSAEERNLLWLARSLVEHPELARCVPRDELDTLVSSRPLAELVAGLVDDAGARGALDLDALADRLSREAQGYLRALAVEETQIEAAAAARTVEDTILRLRTRRHRERQREITRLLSEPGADAAALLAEKRRLREEYERFSHPPMERR